MFYERLYLVLTVTGVAAVCAWWISLTLPAVYRAQARCYVPLQPDTLSLTSEDGNLPTMPKLPTASDSMHDALIGALKGGDLLESVAARVPDRSREEIRKNVDFSIDAYNLIVISAYDTDPVHARDIAGYYLEDFREKLDTSTRESLRSKLSVLDDEVIRGEAKVRTLTDQRLKLLEDRGSVDFSAEYRESVQRAAALRNELDQIEVDVVVQGLRRDSLNELIAARPDESMTARTEVVNPRIDSLRNELANAELLLAQLRSRYREEHPEVKAQLRLIEILEDGLETERSHPTVEGSRTYSPDALRNQYIRSLGDVDLALAGLTGKQDGMAEQYEVLQLDLVTMPRFKATLDEVEVLLRTARGNLTQLHERRNEVQFYLARRSPYLVASELPVLSPKPYLPRKGLNAAVAGALGLMVSLLLIVLRTRLAAQREAALW